METLSRLVRQRPPPSTFGSDKAHVIIIEDSLETVGGERIFKEVGVLLCFLQSFSLSLSRLDCNRSWYMCRFFIVSRQGVRMLHRLLCALIIHRLSIIPQLVLLSREMVRNDHPPSSTVAQIHVENESQHEMVHMNQCRFSVRQAGSPARCWIHCLIPY